jgi:hypothetical protein
VNVKLARLFVVLIVVILAALSCRVSWAQTNYRGASCGHTVPIIIESVVVVETNRSGRSVVAVWNNRPVAIYPTIV